DPDPSTGPDTNPPNTDPPSADPPQNPPGNPENQGDGQGGGNGDNGDNGQGGDNGGGDGNQGGDNGQGAGEGQTAQDSFDFDADLPFTGLGMFFRSFDPGHSDRAHGNGWAWGHYMHLNKHQLAALKKDLSKQERVALKQYLRHLRHSSASSDHWRTSPLIWRGS
ncbi:MAG TPA: hypothetical protein VKB55_13835, partial [Nocardioidaceae bacterium]|nr:hypothetical protein [Nocardioidaceae bacterium]